MKLDHPLAGSDLFELVKTLEVDLQFGEEVITTRVELFRSATDPSTFRYRTWELELFRLTPSFPRDANQQPAHVTDDTIMANRPFPGGVGRETALTAPSVEDAFEAVMADLRKSLDHVHVPEGA